MFKIGDLDGVSVIMTAFFVVFLVSFCQAIHVFRCIRNKCCKKRAASSLNCVVYGKAGNSSALTPVKDLPPHVDEPDMISPDANNFDTSPLSHENINLVKKKNLKRRISQLNFLDQMKYFGEKLEKFIEQKFTK